MKLLIGAYNWLTGQCLWHDVRTDDGWETRRYRLDSGSWEVRKLSPEMAAKAEMDWATK